MRSSVPSAATANVGAVRLSASEARSRMQAGSGVATLTKKLETRRSDMVVGLMPVGGGMDKPSPDRAWFARGAAGDEAHKNAMNQYFDKAVRLKKKQENNMGLFNDWLERAGYPAVAKWELVDGKRELVPLVDERGHPMRAEPSAILDYMLKMAHGDAQSVPKGGEPEYRNGEQYRKVFGQRWGDMHAAYEREYGYGPYASEPFRFSAIEKKVYSIRAWYQQVLVETELSNPGWNARVKLCLSMLAQWMGRARVNEPTPLTRMHVSAAQQRTNMKSQDEVGMLTLMTVNLPMGRRIIDVFLLDWDEVRFVVSELLAGQSRGAELHFLLNKTNREARNKPAMEAGVAVEELTGAVMATYKKLADVPTGHVLVVSEDELSVVITQVREGVHVITRQQESDGVLPSWHGVWFKPAGKSYAVHAWGSSESVTRRMRTLLRKCNRRAGEELVPEAQQ